MCGNADLMNDLRDLGFDIRTAFHRAHCGDGEAVPSMGSQALYVLTKAGEIDGLEKTKLRSRLTCLDENALVGYRGNNDEGGKLIGSPIHGLSASQNADAIQLGEPNVKNNDIGMKMRHFQ